MMPARSQHPARPPVGPAPRRPAARAILRSVVLGVVMVAALGSVAAAKPKLAILGLEVVGELDPDQTKVARQLTNGLRERASAGSGPYELAPNSEKELVDEKLMNNCGTEALSCMSPIGLKLSADYLMYGKIEKVDRGYHVTIKLLRVANKMPMPTYSEVIPLAEIRSDSKAVAKRVYARLTASDEGTLTIRVSNVDRATVYVDDEPMGTTSSGVLTISVPEGRRRIAVVATEKGWKRHEETLSVNGGDSRNIPVELVRATKRADAGEKRDGGDGQDGRDDEKRDGRAGGSKRDVALRPPGSEVSHTTEGVVSDSGGGRTGWRALFALSVATGLAGGVGWYYGWSEIKEAERGNCKGCSDEEIAAIPDEERIANNERGRRGHTITIVGAGVAVLGTAVGAFTFYKGFVASNEKKPVGTAGRSTRPRRTLTVTPVVAPSGGGATLRFDW